MNKFIFIVFSIVLFVGGFSLGYQYTTSKKLNCITIKGKKGINGAGDGGDAVICGNGSTAIGGAGGASHE
jgi:hypothetical protein